MACQNQSVVMKVSTWEHSYRVSYVNKLEGFLSGALRAVLCGMGYRVLREIRRECIGGGWRVSIRCRAQSK